MKRVCFLLQVRPEMLKEYLANHQVWPEMLAAMHEVGIRNYSLFSRPDGLCVGYLEAENPEASLALLGKTDVNRRWQEGMARYFGAGSGDLKSGGTVYLNQYFYME